MLAAYYDKTCDSSALFDDLKIAAIPSYHIHLNHCDVIYLDISLFIPRYRDDIEHVVDHIELDLMEELSKVFDENISSNDLLTSLYSLVKPTGEKWYCLSMNGMRSIVNYTIFRVYWMRMLNYCVLYLQVS